MQSKSDAFTINLPLQFTKAPLLFEHNLSTSIVLGNTENINSLANQTSSSINAEIHKKPIELFNQADAVYTLCIGEVEFFIGAFDVLENMAYLLERLLYSDNDPAPTYPYKTIEILTKSLYSDFSMRPDLMCALCELSLSTSNPGRFYFDSLIQLEKSGIIINTIDDLLCLYGPSLSFKYLGDREVSIHKLNSDTTRDAVEIIKKIFPDKSFNELIDYTVTMLNKALASRINDPLFITRGMTTANPREYYFSTLVNNVGVPLMFDKYNDLYMPETAPNEFLFFSSISTFMKIFIDGEIGCELYPGCVRNMRSFANSHKVCDHCLTAPWKLCEKEKLCPLASLLTYWGIDKKNYQYV